MKGIKMLIGIAALFFSLSASPPVLSAGGSRDAKTITIQVKGLACPFCAYGLEKRIKENGAEKVKIYIDKGLAQAIYPQRMLLDIANLREAVKKGGFTPGSIEVEATGALDRKEGRWVFELAGSGDLFLVKEDSDFEKMVSEVKRTVPIRINAALDEIKQEGHGQHPPTLKILSYEIPK